MNLLRKNLFAYIRDIRLDNYSHRWINCIKNTEYKTSAIKDTDLTDIFKLRYNVMVKNRDSSPFTDEHYCIHTDGDGNKLFYDDFDFKESTQHYIVRKDCMPVASLRLVDGNHTKLVAEHFGWYDIRAKHPYIGDNMIEPSRLVADKSIRGSHIIPLAYLHTAQWCVENDIDYMIGLVNSKERKLLRTTSPQTPSLVSLM